MRSLTAARDALEKANRDYDKAERDLKEAEDFLEELTVGTGGPAGPALTALRAEGIDAASILDLITLPAADRLAWEVRLSPYARTIIVSRDDVTRSRGILAAHPGIPLILCDGSAFALEKTAPGDDGLLGELLRRLGDRMPETGHGWVEDPELRLDIQGGYNPPLTDRQSAIAAARETVDNLREKLGGQLTQHASAESAVTRAENLLAAARASVEITGKQSELDRLLSQALELTEKIVNARDNEEESRAAFATADRDFNSVDQRRTQMNAEMEVLKHGSAASGAAPGLAELMQDAADARRPQEARGSRVAAPDQRNKRLGRCGGNARRERNRSRPCSDIESLP